MVDTNFSEYKIDLWLDKARASSQFNETNLSLLTWLFSIDDKIDIGYQPKRELNS